jgi:trigger factor
MRIEVKEIENCKLNVFFEADQGDLLSKKDEVILKFKDAKVPGFRNGKADRNSIRLHFAKEINEELKKEMANEAYQKFLHEKKVKPFGFPKFTSINLENNNYSCSFETYVVPVVDLKEYKGFEIPKVFSDKTIDQISQEILQELRVNYGDVIPYTDEDFVQESDNIIIDYTTIDVSEDKSIDRSGQLHTVGKGNIKQFDESLLGMKIGEVREFSFRLGDNLKDSSETGKEFKFKVKLVMGSKVSPSPLDDSLASKVGISSFEELQKKVNIEASNQVEQITENKLFDQISKRLVENHQIDVPYWMSLSEARLFAKSKAVSFESLPDEEKKKLIEQCEKSVKLSLILDKIRESEPEAQLSDEELYNMTKQEIDKMAPPEESSKILENVVKAGQLGIFFNRIKDNFTLKFVLNNSKLVE